MLQYWNIFTLGSLLGTFSIVFEKELFMGYQTTVLGERNLKNVLGPLKSFAEQEQQKLVPTLSASPARLPICTCLLPQWDPRHNGDRVQEWSHYIPLKIAQVIFLNGKGGFSWFGFNGGPKWRVDVPQEKILIKTEPWHYFFILGYYAVMFKACMLMKYLYESLLNTAYFVADDDNKKKS